MEHIYNEYLLSDIFKFVQIVESGDLYTFEEAYSKEIGSYLKLFYRNISISHASEILVNLKSKDFSYMQEKGESFLLKQDAEFFFKVNAISKSVQSNKLPLIKKMKRGLNLIAWSPLISYRSLQSPDTQIGSGSETG